MTDMATFAREADMVQQRDKPRHGISTPQQKTAEPLDLAAYARDRGIKHFMVSFTDLFGSQRAKLVPAEGIAEMQAGGAGFAGFATWLDLTPAHPDMLGIPDASSVIQLPWKKEVAWVASNCVMSGGVDLA
ncbi:hypothetical protein O4J55_16320, partial [Paracoccus sp. PXZ]